MQWLENVRSKSHEEKVRILKTIVVICLIVLLLAWVVFEKISGRDGFLGESLIDRIKQSVQ